MMDGLNGPETTSLIRSKCAMHTLLGRHDYDLLLLFAIPDQQSMRQTAMQASTGMQIALYRLTPHGSLRKSWPRVRNHESLFDSGQRRYCGAAGGGGTG